MKPTATQPVFLFTSAPLSPHTYASLAVLIPQLSSLAPLQIEAWATAIYPVAAPPIVHMYLYHRGALPPPPSYVPTTPAVSYPGIDQGGSAVPVLPAESGLIAQVTLVANHGAPALVTGTPVMGPGAPALGGATPPPVAVAVTGQQRSEAVTQVGDWIAYYAMANGQQVPWAYSAATAAGATGACSHGHGGAATEQTALLNAHEENRRLRNERKALCFLCLLCCCCH